MIRDAEPRDAPALAALVNEAITGTTITFRSVPVTPEDRADWIAYRQRAGFGVLVAEAEGRFAGFASYGFFRGGDGYALTVEHTVQLAEPFHGRGLGRALMAALTDHARGRGFHVMVGAISAENRASVAFHEAIGFRRVGVMPQVGQKFGRWLDLELWQMVLDGREGP
ncbi:GNAT family N-acetyltransferase [Paracoccus sp. S-4012]|uniref:GNAT family N-acetyltransferase n=1 Tax=Paracoccus sp. S-4012 TaxID=2665648 RepID=UPI00132CBC8B|nr:GNAT family N-acetyltransferase [Paracoccus sp. S-4012]